MVPAGAGLARWTSDSVLLSIELKLSFSSILPGFMGVEVCLWVPSLAMIDVTAGRGVQNRQFTRKAKLAHVPDIRFKLSIAGIAEWGIAGDDLCMPEELGTNE